MHPAEPQPKNAQPAKPSPLSRLWLTAAFVVVTALGVGVALKLHGSKVAAPPAARPDLSLHGTAPSALAAAAGENPLATTGTGADLPGLTDLANLPADLAMPPGAQRQSLVRLSRPGLEQVKAEYVMTGEPAAAEQSLRDRLAQLGWRLARRVDDKDTGTTLVFDKSGDSLNLRLQRQGACVNIVAVITRAGAPGPDRP